jgi:hypothetical protein
MEFIRRLWLSAAVVAVCGVLNVGVTVLSDSRRGPASEDVEIAAKAVVKDESPPPERLTPDERVEWAALTARRFELGTELHRRAVQRIKDSDARASEALWSGLGIIFLGTIGVIAVHKWGLWLFSPRRQ